VLTFLVLLSLVQIVEEDFIKQKNHTKAEHDHEVNRVIVTVSMVTLFLLRLFFLRILRSWFLFLDCLRVILYRFCFTFMVMSTAVAILLFLIHRKSHLRICLLICDRIGEQSFVAHVSCSQVSVMMMASLFSIINFLGLGQNVNES
jgi:hypothetical protein